ncbi:MAG: hypothetical protein ABI041_16070 [Bdellovibrionia bacterium]
MGFKITILKEKPVQLSLRAVGPNGSLETEEVLLLNNGSKNLATGNPTRHGRSSY